MTSSTDGVQGGPPPNSIAGLSLSIFSDLLSNLTHDLVLQSHRQEKLLRARVQQNPSAALSVMSTEVTCSRCHLPQHTAQTLQQADASDKKKFCSKLPFQKEAFHDIYGNPFPTISGTAKEKKAAASAAAADSPTPDPSDTAAPAPKAGKNSGIVYFKCTCCENEKVASVRYAAHLEKCLGLSGRKSSRAAMAKMNSSSGGGSPMLQPADAPTGGSGGKLGGSRKPSPEKKSPVPPPAVLNGGGDEIKVSTSILSALPTGAGAVTGTATATPKKKKKKAPLGANVPAPIPPAPIPHDGLETLEERDRDRERELAPLLPILKDPTAPPPKKRKRKAEIEGTINLSGPGALLAAGASTAEVDLPKPPMKKQKMLGAETPGTKKQKFKKQSPAPGAFPKKSVLVSPVTGGAPVDQPPGALPQLPPPSTPKQPKPKVAKPKLSALGAGMSTPDKATPARPMKKAAAGADGLPKKPKGPGKGKLAKLAGKGIGAGKGVGGGIQGGGGPGSGSVGSGTSGSVAVKGIARKGVPQ